MKAPYELVHNGTSAFIRTRNGITEYVAVLLEDRDHLFMVVEPVAEGAMPAVANGFGKYLELPHGLTFPFEVDLLRKPPPARLRLATLVAAAAALHVRVG